MPLRGFSWASARLSLNEITISESKDVRPVVVPLGLRLRLPSEGLTDQWLGKDVHAPRGLPVGYPDGAVVGCITHAGPLAPRPSASRPTSVRAVRGCPDGTVVRARDRRTNLPRLSLIVRSAPRKSARASTTGNAAWVMSSPGADSLVIHFTKTRVLRKGSGPGRAEATIYRKASRSLAKPPVEPCAGAANCAVWPISCPAPSATQ